MIFRLGITDKARKAMVWKGEGSSHPSARAAATQAWLAEMTSSSDASESNPAIGSFSSALTIPPSTTTTPPPVSDRRRTARSMSSSFTPTTTMLCASCATVEASAPLRSPKPRTKPSPMRPVPRCRSTTAILRRSRPGSESALAPSTSGSSTSDSVTIWSGTIPITRAPPSLSHGTAKSFVASGRMRTVWRTHSGTSTLGTSPTGRPALSTSSGTKRSRSGRTRTSAW